MVASGGHDKNVLIWDLEEHATSISDRSFPLNRTEAEHLKARITLTGHRDRWKESSFAQVITPSWLQSVTMVLSYYGTPMHHLMY